MLDIQQAIIPGNTGYLIYFDGDGTVHYFQGSGTQYTDEDGLGLTITKSGTGALTATPTMPMTAS